MPEALLQPLDEQGVLFRYSRESFREAGMDNFTTPPAQNPDMFQNAVNVMPPLTGVFQRRWGYHSFSPKVDAGASGSDDFVQNVSPTPDIVAQRVYDYENLSDNTRTIIATASDGTGNLATLTNNVLFFDANGHPISIFAPSIGARPPRAVNSRDYMFFADGIAQDNQAWNIDNGIENWGIAAPTTAPIVQPPSQAGTFIFQLTNAANASGGNTVYTGTNLGGLVATAFVTIAGFTTFPNQNNGIFQVVSSTSTTVTVSNPNGLAEGPESGPTLTTDQVLHPTTLANGWAANLHPALVSSLGGVVLTPNIAATGYTNPGNAFDNNLATAAIATANALNTFGVIYTFSAPGQTLTNLSLNVLSSSINIRGQQGGILFPGATGVWFSLDGGNTWVPFYVFSAGGGGTAAKSRAQQWDSTPIPNGQTLTNVMVLASMASSTATGTHNIFEVNISGNALGSGPITLQSGRRYFASFANSTDGDFSDLSPISASTGAFIGGSVNLTGIPISGDPQVDTVYILATADGGNPTTLFLVGTVTNGTTTFSDTISEINLLLQPVYVFTDSSGNQFGLINNQPAPTGDFPILHQGRIFMIVGHQLAFSKNIAELTTPTGVVAGRFEKDWPPTYVLDISSGAEVPRGLYSDGSALYIGTSRHIRRLLGDSPDNFSEPQVVFNEAGLLTQNVWQTVFLESTPVGVMWMTPDYRVLISDFNTFRDVGMPIQTTLNTINSSAAQTSWAMFAANAQYNLYILAIPTGNSTTPNTLCVFDMRMKKWYIWQLATNPISGLYYVNLAGVPRWMFFDQTGVQQLFSLADVTDGGISLVQLASDSFPTITANLTTDGWSVPTGYNSISVIGGNTARPNGGSCEELFTSFGVWPADQYSQSQVSQLQESVANDVIQWWLTVRGNTAGTLEYRFMLNATSPNTGNGHTTASGGTCQAVASISLVNSQVPTILVSKTINVLAGDNFTFQVKGTTLSVFQNNNLILTATDGTIATGTPGIGANTPGGGEQSNAQFFKWTGGQVTGAGAGITSTLTTSWLDFGDALGRKVLNEIESSSSLSNITLSLSGASQDINSFLSPTTVFSAVAPITNIFGQLKNFTAGLPARDRFYQVTWSATSTPTSLPSDIFLSSFSIESITTHRV